MFGTSENILQSLRLCLACCLYKCTHDVENSPKSINARLERFVELKYYVLLCHRACLYRWCRVNLVGRVAFNSCRERFLRSKETNGNWYKFDCLHFQVATFCHFPFLHTTAMMFHALPNEKLKQNDFFSSFSKHYRFLLPAFSFLSTFEIFIRF